MRQQQELNPNHVQARFAISAREKPPTLDDIHDLVTQDDRDKWDVLVPRSEIQMHNGRVVFEQENGAEQSVSLTLSHWAGSQLCQRLDIPTAYFRRCPAYLQDAQYNFWSQRPHLAVESSESGHNAGAKRERNELWLLRSRKEMLRAALTDRYIPLDNHTLLDSLLESLPPHLQVRWFSMDDESFHLRIVDPTARRQVSDGDDLFAGLHICNSEVGKRKVTIDILAYRLICTNGLIGLVKGKSLFAERHTANASTKFAHMLSDGLQEALIAARSFVDKFAWASTQPVSDMDGELNRLREQLQLSDAFVKQVEDSVRSEQTSRQETVYGLINGLTNAAQRYDADRRYEIEMMAGRMLNRSYLRR